MSLYDGFNGLQIGSGLNALHQGMAARNGQALQGLGNALDSFVQNLQAANREKVRKKSALDYLLGNGYTREQAQQVTDTVGPEIVGQLMQRDWNKADLADERDYREKIRKEDLARGDLATGEQAMRGFLLQVLAKPDGYLRSRREIERDNKIIAAAKEFYENNPQFGVKWEDIAREIGIDENDDESLDHYLEMIPKPDENGMTDPAAFQKYKEDLIKSGKWSDLAENGNFSALWDLNLSKAMGDQLTRDALMLGSGKIATEQDAAKKKAQVDFDKRIKALKEKLLLGEQPKLTKAEFDALAKDSSIRNLLEMLKRQGIYK